MATKHYFYVYDTNNNLRGKLIYYTDGIALEGYTNAYLKSASGTYYIQISSAGLYSSNTITVRGDVDPSGNCQMGNATYYWNDIYTESIHRNYEFSFQVYDDIALIRQMKENPLKPGFIDKKTIPSIMIVPPEESRQIERNRALAQKNEALAQVEKMEPGFHKTEALKTINERYNKAIQHIDDTLDNDLCNIDALKEISLSFGAIRQLADKLDAMENRIKILERT